MISLKQQFAVKTSKIALAAQPLRAHVALLLCPGQSVNNSITILF